MPDEEELEKLKEEEMKKLLKKAGGEAAIPEEKGIDFTSKEYRQFKKEEEMRKKRNWYEILANFSGKLLKISPGSDSEEALRDNIEFCNLKVTPKDVMSFSILAPFILSLLVGSLLIIGVVGLLIGFLGLMGCMILFYYLYNYPSYKAKQYRIKASSEAIMAILYMSIYMKSTPNLEGAVNFAALNLSGPLAYEFRELLWEVDMREYETMDEALGDYSTKWKAENEEFVEAIEILRNCGTVSPERRDTMLDEAVNIILDRTRERMKEYAQSLNMPVTGIYALGVLLPLIGLVLFPMMMIFLHDVVKPIFLVVGYNIVLPGILFWLVNKISTERPVGFPKTDISSHPDLPKSGCMRIFGKNIPILPVSLIIFILITGLSGFAMYNHYNIYSGCQTWIKENSKPEDLYISKGECEARLENFFYPLALSLIPLWGFVLGFSSYLLMEAYQKNKIRKKVEKIERQFPTALFQLGNQISYGTSLESALDKARGKLKEKEMKELYSRAVRNIKQMNLTFKGAFFDEVYGALRYYPSSLIKNVMRMVADTLKKGVRMAALTMLTISRYLKGVRDVEEEIKSMVSSTVTSMKFLALFLAPLVAGITVTMAVVILKILTALGGKITAGGVEGAGGMMSALPTMLTGLQSKMPISPGIFQLVVGIYAIETSILLTNFAGVLEEGNDPIAQKMNIGVTLIITMFIYTVTVIFSYQMFGSTIAGLLESGL